MELAAPPPEVALLGLRAFKTVATADGVIHDLERRLAAAVQRHILKTEHDLDALAPIEPDELAAGVTGPFRERIVHACLVAALIDGEASPAEVALIEAYARALDVDRDAIATARRLVNDQLIRFRIDVVRRSFLGQRGADFVRHHGVRGLVSVLMNLFQIERPEMAAKYRALEALPAGTLGRGYWEFITRNGFTVPGEKGAGPEPIVFHDCLHVLTDYETTAIEETQIAAFQAGTMKKDVIYGMLFPLAQFHLGVSITPTTTPERGVIDPELWIKAFVRGTKTTIDLATAWQPWDDFHRPVEELRIAYHIEPR